MNGIKTAGFALLAAALVATIGLVLRQGRAIDQLEERLDAQAPATSPVDAASAPPVVVDEDSEDPAALEPAFDPATAAIPAGLIAMWSGSPDAVPSGWLLCDGSEGTPDLSDRFILGTVSASPEEEKTGGGSVLLTSDNMPSHAHWITHNHDHDLSIDPASHEHSVGRTRTDVVGRNYEGNRLQRGGDRGLWTGDSVSTGASELQIVGEVEHFVGSSAEAGNEDPLPVEIVPRYYRLAFIMKVDG